MDDEETCRKDYWFSTDVKTGEERPQPAPFDQDFYLVLNVVRYDNFRVRSKESCSTSGKT